MWELLLFLEPPLLLSPKPFKATKAVPSNCYSWGFPVCMHMSFSSYLPAPEGGRHTYSPEAPQAQEPHPVAWEDQRRGECSNGGTRGSALCPEPGTGSPRARVCRLRPCDALFEATLVLFCRWREHFPFYPVFLCLGSCGTNPSSHFPGLFPCQTLQVERRVCSSMGIVETGTLILRFLWK